MLTLPISGGRLDSELLDKSNTESFNLHASTGYSFNYNNENPKYEN